MNLLEIKQALNEDDLMNLFCFFFLSVWVKLIMPSKLFVTWLKNISALILHIM